MISGRDQRPRLRGLQQAKPFRSQANANVGCGHAGLENLLTTIHRHSISTTIDYLSSRDIVHGHQILLRLFPDGLGLNWKEAEKHN
jgi:hypothetical protein